MRTIAEFTDPETALAAHRALVDAGVPPEEIEIRSAYPLPEHAIPPCRSHPMHLWTKVKCMWFVGAFLGAFLVIYTQLDWKLPTSGHPLVPIPIDVIITYESAMLTSLIMTLLFFFFETRRYRKLCPPKEEDLPVAEGNVALVVEGSGAQKAQEIVKAKGAKSVVNLAVLFLCLAGLLPGCGAPRGFDVKMRTQPAMKGTEAPAVRQPDGTVAMPGPRELASPHVAPLGYRLPAEIGGRRIDKKSLTVPPEYKNLANPVPRDHTSVERGKILYADNCAFCHGPLARGDGPVGKDYIPIPPDLTGEKVAGQSDGELFYRITIGPGTMPTFANRLTTKERFDVINYLRWLREHKS